jgi:hypothetical protein
VTPRNAVGPGPTPARGHGGRLARWRGPASAAAVSASRCSRLRPVPRPDESGGSPAREELSRNATTSAPSNATTTARTATVQRVARVALRGVEAVNGGPFAARSSRVSRRFSGRFYNPANASRCSVSGPFTKAAAISGSVGPVPNEGQSLASTQTPHAGLRAWQTRRPWKITR